MHSVPIQLLKKTVEDVPTKAVSMGIGSIMKSKEIVLMAFGESKADHWEEVAQSWHIVDVIRKAWDQTQPDFPEVLVSKIMTAYHKNERLKKIVVILITGLTAAVALNYFLMKQET